MPPRRPGGKYKGVITRSKGEETLALEADIRRRKKLEEHIAKLEEKRDTDKKAAEEMKRIQEEQQEEARRRVMNFMMGGNRGNTRKFFKAWMVGVTMGKKERKILERNRSWRLSCTCHGACQGQCMAHVRLTDVTFKLPFDRSRESGMNFMSSTGESQWPPNPLLQLPRMFGNTGTTNMTMTRSASGFAGTFNGLSRSDSRGACTRGLVKPSAWPCRCKTCRGPLPEWTKQSSVEVMTHYQTGRRCLVDQEQKRFAFADVTRPHLLDC